eukprot:UN27688
MLYSFKISRQHFENLVTIKVCKQFSREKLKQGASNREL